MTAGDRLRFLAGQAGAAGVLLLLVGSGATAGAALVDYSELPTGTAAQHLLVDRVQQQQLGGGQRKATEEELWRQLPEPQVIPKVKKVEIEVVERVFLPSSEVTPDEVASIAREVARKFKKNTVVVEDDDDEEAILLLLGVL